MDNIYLGVNYYPEDWDESLMDSDIAKMKECGFNVARIGEFAWKKDEPREGEFDFSWLHRVVDKLGAAGIRVIMGTPTATPPHWLYRKYPDMAVQQPDGTVKSHGGRRHCCSSNPHYRHYSAIIVEKLAQEFGSDPNVMGWQIDNEIYPYAPGCVCPHCMDRFHSYLKEKYGTAENLNAAWNLNLFSQAYDSIDDVPAPYNAWHNPHIKQEYLTCQAKNHVDFVHMQAAILKKYTAAPIGTDTMPYNAIDYRELNSKLDVAQFNHYNTAGNLLQAAFWIDYMKHFSKIPLWNTETQPCWNGSTSPGMPLQPEGFIYANTWLPFMLGGQANLYWLWRTHWAGHELMHGAVLDSCGRYTHANHEIRHAAEDLCKAEALLVASVPVSDTALLFTSRNWVMHESQEINSALQSLDADVLDLYQQLLHCGIHTDVIDACEPLDSYKLLFSPTAFTLEEGNFPERVTRWVQNGGVWVVGPLTDIRTAIGTKYRDRPYGFLEALTGAHLAYTLPQDQGLLLFTNENGQSVSCTRSFELFDAGAFDPLITVTGGYSTMVGKSVAAVCSVGKGKVILLGTFPEEKELQRIIKKAAGLAGAEMHDVSQGIMITRRQGDTDLVIAADLSGRGGVYRFSGSKTDLLTGLPHRNAISLSPYQLALLR